MLSQYTRGTRVTRAGQYTRGTRVTPAGQYTRGLIIGRAAWTPRGVHELRGKDGQVPTASSVISTRRPRGAPFPRALRGKDAQVPV